MKYSLIAPTFGRPEEVSEFLESLSKLDYSDFELILSDGTPGDTLRPQIKGWIDRSEGRFRILYEEFLPVSDARNLAAKEAKGAYLIFLDSDCLIPPGYLRAVDAFLAADPVDLFGGPDAADEDFSLLQKSISYSMTSFLTTGGIRGGKKSTTSYQPRGFNMGIRKSAFDSVNGYDEKLKCGEDVDLSLRLQAAGYRSAFISGAEVYHKRRTNLKAFFRQVYRFGAARIDLSKKHSGQLKLTHLFPLFFSLFALISLSSLAFAPLYSSVFFGYLGLVFLHALWSTRDIRAAFLALVTSLTMFFGYGWGLLRNALHHLFRGRGMDL